MGAAGAAAGELAAIADDVDMPYLTAVAGHATGSVQLAEGDARGALATARAAHAVWQALGAPYEAARSRVVIGRCCQTLDDQDGAALELGSAETAFVQLGAEPDAAAVRAVLAEAGGTDCAAEAGETGGLSRRERQVLGVVATGRTNREIAADLVISDKTVARHVSNIFAKLGLSSRAAATAYAYEHGLVPSRYRG